MEPKRKGARSFKDLDQVIVDSLNRGEIESVNLIEWLAIDQRLLLQSFLKQHDRSHYLESILAEIDKLKKQSSNTLIEVIGSNLLQLIKRDSDLEFVPLMNLHTSDVVRCWATYVVGADESLSLSEKFTRIQPLAADTHFGVREEAWMAMRSSIINDLSNSIQLLKEWTKSDDEYVRRFATEATRPRGVWCQHIEMLKENPLLAIDLLEPLKSDSSKYVRDSVANWLNDAGKTQATFVKDLCRQWTMESTTKETEYIVKRALRTINKK